MLVIVPLNMEFLAVVWFGHSIRSVLSSVFRLATVLAIETYLGDCAHCHASLTIEESA